MRKILLWATVAVIVAAGAVSCKATIPVEPTPVEFTTIAKDYQSAVMESESVVISDEDTWEDIWDSLVAHLLQPPPPPEIDFGDYILLAHFMGERETSGYEVEFIEVLEGDEISVTVRELSPAPECELAQVITAPYDIIQIPKTDKEVKFIVQQEIGPSCLALPWYGWPMFHDNPQRTGRAEANGIITDPNTLKWPFLTGDSIMTSPAVDRNGIIYIASNKKLYAIKRDGSQKWAYPFTSPNSEYMSSPAVSEGLETVFVASGNTFYAINRNNGVLRWSFTFPHNEYMHWPDCSPAIPHDHPGTPYCNIFITTIAGLNSGYLYKIEAWDSNYQIIWDRYLSDGMPFGPAVAGSVIYVTQGAMPAQLHAYCRAIKENNGNDIWIVDFGVAAQCRNPAVEIIDGVPTIYFGVVGGLIAMQDQGNQGVKKWFFPVAGEIIYSCPAIKDLNGDGTFEIIFGGGPTVYAITDDGFHPSTDPPVFWQFATGDDIYSSAAVALAPQPTVFIGSDDNNIYSINWDGTPLGQFTTGGRVFSSPAVAQPITSFIGSPGWVFVGSDDGNLYAFGPA